MPIVIRCPACKGNAALGGWCALCAPDPRFFGIGRLVISWNGIRPARPSDGHESITRKGIARR